MGAGAGVMLRVIRIVFGLFAACVAAAAVLLLHVVKPLQLASLPTEALYERLAPTAELLALLATQLATFAIPFGLILAIVTEVNRWRSLPVYLVIGLSMAAAGYLLQFQSEDDFRTVLNAFAAQAFALQGAVGGFVYWLLAGRFAGWRAGGGPFQAEPLPIARQRPKISTTGESVQSSDRSAAKA